MVIESSRAIAEVAREIQVNEGTLGNWVNKYRVEHADEEPPLSVSDRARLRELERENRELRIKAEFLGKAAALKYEFVDVQKAQYAIVKMCEWLGVSGSPRRMAPEVRLREYGTSYAQHQPAV